MGTQLEAGGVVLATDTWTAFAVRHFPEEVSAIHRSYADAGAEIHTAATFRTQPQRCGQNWRSLLDKAVELCRDAVPAHHLVFGSLAPTGDCYRPNEVHRDAESIHGRMANALARSQCDGLLCETFANPAELVTATRVAAETGLPVWSSLTAGYRDDLVHLDEVRSVAERCQDAGATSFLINCSSPEYCRRALERLRGLAIPYGASANIPLPGSPSQVGASDYGDYASIWYRLGATRLGGCCGTGPEHIRALAHLRARSQRALSPPSEDT